MAEGDSRSPPDERSDFYRGRASLPLTSQNQMPGILNSISCGLY